MEAETVTIQVDPASAEILRTLQERAEEQGKTLDALLRPLIEEAQNGAETAPEPTLDEFMQAMESLAEEDIKPLPRDFSREDIYFPRD
jgi:hypothetical protein